MQDVESIEIPISKIKVVAMFLGCLAFVIIGICFVINPQKFVSPIGGSSAEIFLAGCLGIVFFGFLGFSICKRIFDSMPGLIISKGGITDNSSGTPAGFIPWSDITAIKETVVARQRFINLVVRNHNEYVQRQKGALKKKIMQKNFDIYGTGIGISPNSLKIDYSELKDIIERRFSEINAKQG